ncbi:GNAT family N-acetyltransferase [Paenibacillus sp. MER TA 81-3]|uniref:GNAT family N-acetyltransferase n=1 Tax=Paenibacillus sp. MER TA 81-3 TaxID=2939573 RepID=UPI00203C998F|nr:GNAT family N-acetyltransferase [Paenibacillus sp. MER TA 81-3]MCM3340716.1 GNAT family N-acetyltransferase [Paenibacillus sp. MER TA 81-3]
MKKTIVQTDLGRFSANDERGNDCHCFNAVKPAYQGQGLGKYMFSRAVHQMNDTYSVLRLFVTSGNEPEKLYSNLGFLSGDELTDMICSMPQLNDSRG